MEKQLRYVLVITSFQIKITFFFIQFQPVGFVTFHTRAGAEAAKQDLQVIIYEFNDWPLKSEF